MNDKLFDESLRAALPAAASHSLDAKINEALLGHRSSSRLRRGVFLTCAATAFATVAFVTVPIAQAQATIAKMAGALDGVDSVRIQRTAVHEDGQTSHSGVTAYDHGRWYMADGGGNRATYYLDGRLYTLDPVLNAYIVREKPDGPFAKQAHLRLSDMLAEQRAWSWNKRVEVKQTELDGVPVTRAQFENGDLPERYIIFAERKTQLPMRVVCESQELGKWRVREVMTFDYRPRFSGSDFALDLKRKPVLTPEQAEARFEAAVTAKTVGEMPLKKGRLVIRSVDVAQDGTVFVMYQSGERSRRTWRGFALALTDDLGTRYVSPQIFPGGDDDAPLPKEGVLQAEVFIPVEPVSPGQPRSLRLAARRFGNGNLSRQIQVIENGVSKWTDNRHSLKDEDAKDVALVAMKGVRPNCEAMPSYMPRVDFTSYGNEVAAEMAKAGQRGKDAFERKEWSRAERWLNEELRLMRKHERLGYGPWSEAGPKEKLAKIRQMSP